MSIDKTIALKGDRLHFDEPSHTYTYTYPNGTEEVMTSGTQVLKQYFPFDSDGVALKCSKGRNPKYAGKSVKEIQDMWMSKAQFGTDVHQLCEDYLNGEFISIENDRQIKAFNYLQKMKFQDVRNEVKIVAPAWGISGMIDCLVKIDNKWYIWDWKTDRSIAKTAFNAGDKCTGVLSAFDNCNYNKFCFQLGLYRFILDQFYDIDIHGIKVVHFPEHGVTKEYDLPYHIEYIGLLVKNNIKNKAPVVQD